MLRQKVLVGNARKVLYNTLGGGWEEKLREKLEKMGLEIDELFSAPFDWTEVTNFLEATIQVAKEYYPDNPHKALEVTLAIWDYYDDTYDIIEYLDKLIDFTDMFGSVIGGLLELYDDKALRVIVEKILIPLLIGKLFGPQLVQKAPSI